MPGERPSFESYEPHEPTPEERAELVASEVEKLSINLDLRRHPAILERLVDTGEHFKDSVSMARIVRAVFADLCQALELPDEDPEQLMRAAVVHDIGKSGPAGEKGPVHAAVRRLFVPPKREFSAFADGRPKTIHEFLTEMEYPDAAEIEAALNGSDLGVDTGKEAMIYFWRRHVQWTHDILTSAPEPVVDRETEEIASTHHLFENWNPAKLDLKDVPPGSQVLEVIEMAEALAAVDKYQAYLERLHWDHDKAMAMLSKFFNANPPDLDQNLRQKYNAVIAVLDRNKEKLTELLR
jgi:HD-GYP domain-containing protein (c-di-GMP phosphodiesterase class II)